MRARLTYLIAIAIACAAAACGGSGSKKPDAGFVHIDAAGGGDIDAAHPGDVDAAHPGDIDAAHPGDIDAAHPGDIDARPPIDAAPGTPDAAPGTPDASVADGPAPEPADAGVPAGWSCPDFFYGDGSCDCGCGAVDIDCGGAGNVCTDPGCSAPGCAYCNGLTDAGPTTTFCLADWQCDEFDYNDGMCNCGCGAPDAPGDCQTPGCPAPGCRAAGCETCRDVAPDGGVSSPFCVAGWTCSGDLYGDGICDCGCGIDDPDCGGLEGTCSQPGCQAPLCQTCHAAGGDEIACTELWQCEFFFYADGFECDCGCGVPDPDCGGMGCSDEGCRASACIYCNDGNMTPDVYCEAGAPDAGMP